MSAIVVAAALVAVAGANLLPGKPWAQQQASTGQLAPDSSGATIEVPPAATITPSPVIDSGDVFIGSGDFSSGSWVRPPLQHR